MKSPLMRLQVVKKPWHLLFPLKLLLASQANIGMWKDARELHHPWGDSVGIQCTPVTLNVFFIICGGIDTMEENFTPRDSMDRPGAHYTT